MKEHWIKDIHDRLGNYEMDAPDDLWTGISSNMHKVEKGTASARKNKPSIAIRPVRYVAACIAAACIALLLYFRLGHDDKSMDIASLPQVAYKQNVAKHISNAGSSSALQAASCSTNVKPIARNSEEKLASETTPVESNPATEPIVVDVDSVPVNCTTTDDAKKKTDTYLVADNHEAYHPHKASASSRWSFATMAMGMMGSSSMTSSVGDIIVAAGPDGAAWEDNPMLGIGVYNQGQNVETSIKHRLPIRFGFNVAYAINDRLSVESGLVYTLLSSDMREGTADNYWNGEQRLHYVGIPINMKYQLWNNRFLSIYASAGVLTEKCISGNTSQRYVIMGEAKGEADNRVSSHPLQLSANAAVGVQIDVADNIGIYAEPGLSYYFDDNSSLKTIYKEKPFNFNLNLGLRFTLNK